MTVSKSNQSSDYAAPEVLQGKSYKGREQDVWALGVLLYTICYKENPFYNVRPRPPSRTETAMLTGCRLTRLWTGSCGFLSSCRTCRLT